MSEFPQSPPRVADLLTEQFYAWEVLGRGWTVWPAPVDLEPLFRPFPGHVVPRRMVADDGKCDTGLSRFADAFLGIFGEKEASEPPPLPEDAPVSEPPRIEPRRDLVEFQVALPPEYEASREVFEQCLWSLAYCKDLLAFEVAGDREALVAQLAGGRADARAILTQLKAHFPEAVITPAEHCLAARWEACGRSETVILEFGLDREFMVPLRTMRHMATDPLVGICGALEQLGPHELGIFQVLMQPVRHRWAESVIRAVTTGNGEPFFENAPELVDLAKQKLSRPLFAAVVRIAARSPDAGRVWEIAKGLSGALKLFGAPETNELIPLDNDECDSEAHISELLSRASRRSGMILNSDELASIAHLPTAAVRSRKLARETTRTKRAPEIAAGEGLLLGENRHEGETTAVTLKPYQRVRHTHVIGASGTGKSTLLLNLIVEDIHHGQGLAVLDPHGDLIENIVGRIPKERFDDVILLDPGDAEYPVGFNILSAHSDVEKNLLASDLVSVFRRLSTSWGDQMTSVLGNAILAFLESAEGGTLADLRRFLVEPAFRNQFLKTVQDPEVIYYWQREFPLLAGKPQAPLLTRLDTFLRPKPIRYMVSQKVNRLDFAEIMGSGKIFLAKLAQGEIGEENAYLLGTLLVSKFHQMAIGRQRLQEAARRDFWLYIDECHNFVTPSMASILTGVRKYRLGLILAHQELRQLERDREVGSAVLANPYTRACFRVGDDDARTLAEGFAFFEAKDLQSLGTGEAIARMERADFDFNLKVSALPDVDEALAAATRGELVARSRQKYAVPRQEVEALFATARVASAPSAPDKAPQQQPAREESPSSAPTPPPPPDVTKGADESAAPEKIKKASRPTPPEPAPLGRGGPQHKYLQHLIKQLAIGMGFEVDVEKTILEGCVDVELRRGEKRFAFEISVTTPIEHELANVRKCRKAGYDEIVMVCPERDRVEKLRAAATQELAAADAAGLRFVTQEDLSKVLLDFAAKAHSKDVVSHGKRTKVTYMALTPEEAEKRRALLARISTQSMKKLRKNSLEKGSEVV